MPAQRIASRAAWRERVHVCRAANGWTLTENADVVPRTSARSGTTVEGAAADGCAVGADSRTAGATMGDDSVMGAPTTGSVLAFGTVDAAGFRAAMGWRDDADGAAEAGAARPPGGVLSTSAMNVAHHVVPSK